MSEHLITPEQMADRFDVARSTVLDWNRRHRWPHVKVGHTIGWTEEQYAEILRRSTVTPAAPQGLPGQTTRSASRKRAS